MISIVIPAYNEERNIVSTLQQVRSVGPYAIVVVDDGSTDRTAELARPYATVVRHAINRGMGAALMTGTQWSVARGASVIVHFDADGQHQAAEIPKVIGPIVDGATDVVFGSRYLGSSAVPWTKRYLLHMPALALQTVITGMHLTDVHNGFRALSRDAASRIIIRQDRMAHASEIVSEVKRNGLRYTEVPVTISYHEYGQGFVGGLRIIKDLIIKKIV